MRNLNGRHASAKTPSTFANGTNRLVNPGSAGMPLDGDTRAAWAMWSGSEFTFHRTEYDVDRVVAAARDFGDMSDVLVHRYTHASD